MEQSAEEKTHLPCIIENAVETISWRNQRNVDLKVPTMPDSANVDCIEDDMKQHECMLDLLITGFCTQSTDMESKHVPLDIVELIRSIAKSITNQVDLVRLICGPRPPPSGLHSLLGDLSYYTQRDRESPLEEEKEEYMLCSEKGKQLWMTCNVHRYIRKRPDAVFFVAQKYCNVLKIYCCHVQYELFHGNGSFMDEIVRLSYSDPTLTQQLAQSAKDYFAD